MTPRLHQLATESGRSVPEWIGKTPDSKVPRNVRARIFKREGGRCWLSGRKILVGDAWDLDHKVPLHMGGRHAEDNLFPALKDKHRKKSAAELTVKAKADRNFNNHHGIRESGRGFRGWRKMNGEIVWRDER